MRSKTEPVAIPPLWRVSARVETVPPLFVVPAPASTGAVRAESVRSTLTPHAAREAGPALTARTKARDAGAACVSAFRKKPARTRWDAARSKMGVVVLFLVET